MDNARSFSRRFIFLLYSHFRHYPNIKLNKHSRRPKHVPTKLLQFRQLRKPLTCLMYGRLRITFLASASIYTCAMMLEVIIERIDLIVELR